MKPLKELSRRIPPRMSLAILLTLSGFQVHVPAQQQPAPLRRTRLDMVFSSSLFRSVNRNDAIAAVRVWGSMVGRKRGFQVDPTVDVLDDVAEIRKRVQAGLAGILALDVVEYLKLADLPAVEPIFCALRGQVDTPPRYLLLVRGESGISSLEALRGKTTIIHASTGANLGQVWLDAMLHDGRLGRSERFFGAMEVVPKASSAILPVFFGKADAAVVDQASFEVTKEMNPQVGSKLRALKASPQLTEGLICLSTKQVEFREELLEGMRDLHLDVQGKQILLVFRFSRLVPVDKLALEQARELWRKHLLLSRPSEEASLGSLPQPEMHPARRGGTQ